MLQQQFIDIVRNPHLIEADHLQKLEKLIEEYPFFASAHLLLAKGLHDHQSINYPKQLRKTAIIAQSRTILHELIQRQENVIIHPIQGSESEDIRNNSQPSPEINVDIKNDTGPVNTTSQDLKIVYVNTTVSDPVKSFEKTETSIKEEIEETKEIDLVKHIENETEAPIQKFDEEKLNKSIEQEISKAIVQSYVETDIIKTQELHQEDAEPHSFTDWLKVIQKQSTMEQSVSDKQDVPQIPTKPSETKLIPDTAKKTTVTNPKRELIDKIIESDPGRIKLGNNKFFTPVVDAKQSLLENEHLVTETLAKIYALQGNISKAIRAYEILSLKFPQKSVYFASLIEKLKTNK